VTLKESPDRDVAPRNVGDEPNNPAGMGGLQHAMGELGADSLTLPIVSYDESHLHAAIVDREQIAEPHNFSAVRRVDHSDERQRSMVVDAGQHAQYRIGQSGRVREETQISRPRTQAVEERSETLLVAFLQNAYAKETAACQNDLCVTFMPARRAGQHVVWRSIRLLHISVNRHTPLDIPSITAGVPARIRRALAR